MADAYAKLYPSAKYGDYSTNCSVHTLRRYSRLYLQTEVSLNCTDSSAACVVIHLAFIFRRKYKRAVCQISSSGSLFLHSGRSLPQRMLRLGFRGSNRSHRHLQIDLRARSSAWRRFSDRTTVGSLDWLRRSSYNIDFFGVCLQHPFLWTILSLFNTPRQN